jgi:hypothetical protein
VGARIGGALAIVGAAVWALSWTFNLLTEDNARAVLGLSERGWRRLLDPALTLLIIALFAYRRRYSWRGSRIAAIGWAIAALGLFTALVGNVIEFWIGELLYVHVPGQFEPTDFLGFALFMAGVGIFVPVGFIVLGVAHFQSHVVPGWRRLLPLSMGVLSAAPAAVAIFTHAVPPLQDAALGAVFLVFAAGWVMLGYDLWSSAGRAA